jgi:hypothetical protein
MSSVHSDRGWLVIALRLRVNGRLVQVRLYPSIRATREGRRAPLLKKIRELVQMRQWRELAEMFPNCKQLEVYLSNRIPPLFGKRHNGF